MAVLSARPGVALKNIVVAIDFTPQSELALQHAAAIARHFGAKLHLVHAIHPSPHVPAHEATAALARQAEAEAEAKLEREAENCEEVECSRWVLIGDPISAVERILSFDEIDLVVIGTHGAKGLRRLSAGSAAEHFFRHVHCPVLTVGPSVSGWNPVWAPKQILLATDLQSDESVATCCAVLLAREHDAHLALLHVAPPAPPPFPEDQEVTARPYFQSRLRQLLSYDSHVDYPAELMVEFGHDPAAEVIRVAGQKKADLIVLSVHREEPWGVHFVRQAYRIVAEAPCPVLITQRGGAQAGRRQP